jgi:hemerythrin-like domain-containing protein
MKPTEELVAEHRAVLVALEILEKVAPAVAAGDGRAVKDLEKLLDFLRGFVDACHHGKEEDVLFPELERLGIPREGGPIGVMLLEHQAGREHIRAMAEGLEGRRLGDPGASAAILEHARGYAELLRSHIHKENSILFPMADRVVPEEAAVVMTRRFEEIERDRVGPGKHEEYHALLHDLKEAWGVA